MQLVNRIQPAIQIQYANMHPNLQCKCCRIACMSTDLCLHSVYYSIMIYDSCTPEGTNYDYYCPPGSIGGIYELDNVFCGRLTLQHMLWYIPQAQYSPSRASQTGNPALCKLDLVWVPQTTASCHIFQTKQILRLMSRDMQLP